MRRRSAEIYLCGRLNAYGVVEIQQQLIALGYLEGEPDGVFGAGCAEAVEKFQRDKGLPISGEADEVTQQKLAEAYKAKNNGFKWW